MARLRRSPLRGSVTQHQPSVRLRARDDNHRAILLRLGALGGSVLLVIGLVLWLWLVGWPQKMAHRMVAEGLALTQKAHFAVTDVQIAGRRQTPKEDLVAALGLTSHAPILGFDPAAAEARIAKLPWVASVTVERRLPDTVRVNLVEREPMARWQHDGRTVVVDTTGKELQDARPEQFAALPLLVGAGAVSQAGDFLKTLKDYPAVASKMTAAVWVGLRRWDIYLPPKIVAKLPEGDLEGGLRRLDELIVGQKILDRDIVGIDLRFPDHFTLEPVPPSADSRAAGGKKL